jgi:4-diphosphocytidyl-2-C-methyl-D-erythritol kinase
VSDALRLRAHAKLNLALRVGAVRDDGFHPLASVFQTISLCDLLYARRVDGAGGGGDTGDAGAGHLLRLRVAGAELPADNTVGRAVRLLAEEARRQGVEPAPLAMRLVKRVPLGAGLGGGSSDAVAALAACVRLWGLDRARLEASGALHRIAARIGSDVPFFLVGGTALGTGRGTRIAPLEPLPSTWFVVAAPDVQVSTAAAYAAFDRRGAIAAAEGGDSAPAATAPSPPAYRPGLCSEWMGNDLAEVVARMHPEIEEVRQRLLQLGAEVAQMSGSGAASFGSFGGRREASRAARRLRSQDVWARACASVGSRRQRRSLFGGQRRRVGAP